jgi:hypothetical protein
MGLLSRAPLPNRLQMCYFVQMSPLVRDSDAAKIAAVNVLKSVSRTATGGGEWPVCSAVSVGRRGWYRHVCMFMHL